MNKYTFEALITISVSTEVEADTEAEAREIAEVRDVQSLCHYCSSKPASCEWVTSGELDGTPEMIRLEGEC